MRFGPRNRNFDKIVAFDVIKLFKILDAVLNYGISSYLPGNWDRTCAYIPQYNGEYSGRKGS